MKTVKNGKGSRARTTPDDAYRSEIDRIFRPHDLHLSDLHNPSQVDAINVKGELIAAASKTAIKNAKFV